MIPNRSNSNMIRLFYDSYADDYERIYYDYLYSKQTEEMIRYIGNCATKLSQNRISIVDLGCGIGHQLRALYQHIRNERRVSLVGVDISEHMISKAKEISEKVAGNSISFISGDFTTPETINKIIKTTKDTDAYVVTVLGNTLGHLPPREYEKFAVSLCQMFNEKNRSVAFLEVRDGQKLKEEKRKYELRYYGRYQEKEIVLSYYEMDYEEETYPTTVYVIVSKKENSDKFAHVSIRKYYNEQSYYVDVESLIEQLQNKGLSVDSVADINSSLRYGKIYVVKYANKTDDEK